MGEDVLVVRTVWLACRRLSGGHPGSTGRAWSSFLNLHLVLERKTFVEADSARRLGNNFTLLDGQLRAANNAAAVLE